MMFMITSIMMSMLIPIMKHPMSMGLILLIQTIMVAMMTGSMINMSWFSYILIMIMLSGTLVLFVYMASIASNEKFKSPTFMMITVFMMLCISSVSYYLEDQMKNQKIWPQVEANFIENSQILTLIKLFNLHNMWITVMMVVYLFFSMIVISYIVNTHEGPLRMKN